MEGEAEQALLAAGSDLVAEVEEGWIEDGTVVDDQDPARLLDHEQPAAAIAGMGHEQRPRQPVDHQLDQPDPGPRRGLCTRAEQTGQNHDANLPPYHVTSG